MGIQNVSYYTIPVANAFTMFTLSNVDEYTFTASSPDMLYMIWQYYSQTRTGYLHIRTIIPGEIILYGRYAGVLKQVIFITVPPVVKDITLYE